MTIKIKENLHLELVEDQHAPAIFRLVSENRDYLRKWLPWVDNMQSVNFIENFIKGSRERNHNGAEWAFVILEKEKVVGRIGIYKIDAQNKIGEIGYWLGQNLQGKGIVSSSCQGLIDYAFDILHLNRLEIKCGTENRKSQTIPERLGFTKEGLIRQGELVHERFIDLNLYSLLRQEHRPWRPG